MIVGLLSDTDFTSFYCRKIVGKLALKTKLIMPILKLVIVPAKILSSGKHKVRISVSHNSQTRYIPTECIIDDLSQFKEGQVVNRSDASYMNMKLRKKLNFYQETIDDICDPDIYSCSDILYFTQAPATLSPVLRLIWHA